MIKKPFCASYGTDDQKNNHKGWKHSSVVKVNQWLLLRMTWIQLPAHTWWFIAIWNPVHGVLSSGLHTNKNACTLIPTYIVYKKQSVF